MEPARYVPAALPASVIGEAFVSFVTAVDVNVAVTPARFVTMIRYW